MPLNTVPGQTGSALAKEESVQPKHGNQQDTAVVTYETHDNSLPNTSTHARLGRPQLQGATPAVLTGCSRAQAYGALAPKLLVWLNWVEPVAQHFRFFCLKYFLHVCRLSYFSASVQEVHTYICRCCINIQGKHVEVVFVGRVM